jgi:hypothetical protein
VQAKMFVPFIKMLVYSDFGFFFGRVAVVDDRSCHPTKMDSVTVRN